MLSLERLFFILIIVNVVALLAMYMDSAADVPLSKFQVDTKKDFFTQKKVHTLKSKKQKPSDFKKQLKEVSELLEEAQKEVKKTKKMYKKARPNHKKKKHIKIPFGALVDRKNPDKRFLTRDSNPFYLLGAYPEAQFPLAYKEGFEKLYYDEINLGLFNDDDYCEKVDYHNLGHPKNIFKKKNFFTDYAKNTVPRHDIIPKIGRNLMPQFSKYGKDQDTEERKHHLNTRVVSFFVNSDGFHKRHAIGKNFLCATQIYNHIPGHRPLIRKDELIESIDRYAKKFKNKPHCFNKNMFIPYSFRLDEKAECLEFLNLINSKEYKQSLKTEPIQHLIKIGHGSHAGDGVFLLDSNQTSWLNKNFDDGRKCGEEKLSLIAQKYITNPLLLDIGNKFDFRIFMLVASTNPLIVYYHDGVIRASLQPYDKFSKERGKHLTNAHLAEPIFEQAKTKKVYGKTEKQLRDYLLWSLEELQDYLLESGKITDPNWLDNTLRPQFRKAMIHILKMSAHFFWKQSNVYGLFGLDFMLDDHFNVWFIEANPNPQLKSVSDLFNVVLHKVVDGMFEIEFGLYRSRMKRALAVVQKLLKEQEGGKKVSTQKLLELRAEYRQAIKNKFEPEYQIGRKNSFVLVMDESIAGPGAYFGNIESECIAP